MGSRLRQVTSTFCITLLLIYLLIWQILTLCQVPVIREHNRVQNKTYDVVDGVKDMEKKKPREYGVYIWGTYLNRPIKALP